MQTHTDGSTDAEDEYFDIEHIDSAHTRDWKRSNIKEVKSKRLSLLIKPTTYRDVKKIATMKRISVNHLINELLEDLIETDHQLVNKYNETFPADQIK